MSAFASFYFLTQAKFDEYCKLARFTLTPPVRKSPLVQDPNVTYEYEVSFAGPLSSEEIEKDPRYLETKKPFEFLQKNATEPFEYKWSGYVFFDLLRCLKRQMQIDIMEHPLYSVTDTSSGADSWLLTNELKVKYAKEVDPTLFKEHDLKIWYHDMAEDERRETLKEMAAKLSEKEFKRFAKELPSPSEDFPELGKALMDGVRALSKCFETLDDHHVILLQIG